MLVREFGGKELPPRPDGKGRCRYRYERWLYYNRNKKCLLRRLSPKTITATPEHTTCTGSAVEDFNYW